MYEGVGDKAYIRWRLQYSIKYMFDVLLDSVALFVEQL